MAAVAPKLRTDVTWRSLASACAARWPDTHISTDHPRQVVHLGATAEALRPLCLWLFQELGYRFATLIVEEHGEHWQLRYIFLDPVGHGWVYLERQQPLAQTRVASIGDAVHAADWHEREAEDLFGLEFVGHPKLGEFVLHEDWPEGVNPMRKDFDAQQLQRARERAARWQPPAIVQSPGAFIMPIGPVYADFAESAHFIIETTGEDMIRVLPRFFYKYRAVEKLAEGCMPDEALLLAERFSGDSAFAHGWAFCRALETLCETATPPRAESLRTAFAELERLRRHMAVITGLCGATGLAVAQAQSAMLEEELLRLTGEICGHRYFFGLLKPGGLRRDLSAADCARLRKRLGEMRLGIENLQTALRYSSSFLDRIEDVGWIDPEVVRTFGLVGPVARASGEALDLRKVFRYGIYGGLEFAVPVETEGDGYARLRVLFAEALQAADIVEQVLSDLPSGPVSAPCRLQAGTALGWSEAPLGAAFHWLHLDERGRVYRYSIAPPSLRNWHAFRVAAEHFSFQDFPIILATFGLSQAECDR